MSAYSQPGPPWADMKEFTEHSAKGKTFYLPNCISDGSHPGGKKAYPHLLSIYDLISTMPIIYMHDLIKSSQQLHRSISPFYPGDH